MMKSPAIIREAKSFGSELRRYFGILRALLRQEEESRRHAPMEALMELTEPLFLITTLCLFRFMFERASSPSSMISPLGGSIILYYASGLLPKYLFIYVSVKRIGPAVAGPRRRFPIQQRLDSLFVHVVLRVIDFTLLGLLVFGSLYFLDTREAFPCKFTPIILGAAASISLGFCWGMINIQLRRFIWGWQFFGMAINRAMIVMSGCLFLPDFLSPTMRYWISFNPEMHAIALFRTAFYPHYPMTLLDTSYLFYCCVSAVLLALALERVTRRIDR